MPKTSGYPEQEGKTHRKPLPAKKGKITKGAPMSKNMKAGKGVNSMGLTR